jgi:hypothetical protein
MKIIRAISLTIGFLIPIAAIASPSVRASCVDPACCPGCRSSSIRASRHGMRSTRPDPDERDMPPTARAAPRRFATAAIQRRRMFAAARRLYPT